MAFVYILYSKGADRYYTGSCVNLTERLEQHREKSFSDAYTKIADDWELFLVIDNLNYADSRKIEAHIKNMKSPKYLSDLKTYPEMIEKLRLKYSSDDGGSSR